MNGPLRRLFARRPRVRQHDITDCGPAALSAVARFHSIRLPIARIRQLCGTSESGTSLLGLSEAAAALGFATRAVRAGWSDLGRLPFPLIAHVHADGLAHFVVLYGVAGEGVVVMDPRDGKVAKVRRALFETQWQGVLLVIVPTAELQPIEGLASPAIRLWRLARPHGAVLTQALVGSLAYTVFGLATAVFVQKLIDSVLPTGNGNLLNLMAVALGTILVLQAVIGGLRDLLILRTGQKLDGALILGYYRHLMRLPQTFFDSMRVGEIVSRVNDAVKIRAFVNDTAVGLAVSVMVVVLSYGLMAIYSPRITAWLALSIPLYFTIYWCSNRVHRSTQREIMETAAGLEAQLVESVGAAGTIKRFNLEGEASRKSEGRLVALLRAVYASALTAIWARNATELTTRLAVLAALWIGATAVMAQRLTAGELMSVYSLIAYLGPPTVALIGAPRSVQDALIAADRLFEIIDLETEPVGASMMLAAGDVGDVAFDHVSFRYGGRENVLRTVNFTARAGAVTAIIGPSGSGKTTIGALLQRIYEPTEGRIRIGDHDIARLDLSSLRRRIATVPQDVHLFAGNVIENIALDDRSPDMRKIFEICGRLGIAEFCSHLPRGFQTTLGERGVGLSGGQRQRIAIARAIYRDPAVIILDEATAALDPSAEAAVMEASRELAAAGVVVIMITHRLPAAAAADHIHVLEGGTVVESGQHTALLRDAGPYRRLWERHVPPELRSGNDRDAFSAEVRGGGEA